MNLSGHHASTTPLEKATFIHVAVLMLSSSWIFGGNIWWMRTALSVWATLSVPLTVLALWQHGESGRAARRRIAWLAPWVAFVIIVGFSCLNPSFRPMVAEGAPVLVNVGPRWPSLPSCVSPEKTLNELWFYAGTYLAAFNLLLVPRHRRPLRWLVFAGVINCLVLAVYGSLQKLMGTSLYFGATSSPNLRFFATFIYNNHWGAFLILWLSAAGGLLFFQADRASGRDLWHSPFSLLVAALLLMATTAPLSASRAAMLLATVVVAVVTFHGLLRVKSLRQQSGRTVWPPLVLILLLVGASTGAIGWLAERSINARYVETKQALARPQPIWQERLELYRDTWQLAVRKPLFGWGLESYATTFTLIRPRPLEPNRQYESSYAEAHSDWLQSFAETGIAGTVLVTLMGLIPLVGQWRRARPGPLAAYVLLGCALVSLYAMIEFPFANGAVVISFWVLFFAALRLGTTRSLTPANSPRSDDVLNRHPHP